MSIQGKTIVFTGKISQPRHIFQKLVEDNGGVAGSDVTSKTDYLVVGEKPGSKLMRATTLGIPTISEEEFLKLLQTEEVEETPLSFAELQELDSHMEERACSFCNRTYRQFDTVPNYNTCPICEVGDIPKCPNCGYGNSQFITNFGLYHCCNCWQWFKAPYSWNSQKVSHIHIWFKETKEEDKAIKECFCGTTLITYPDGHWEKHEPSHIIDQARKEAHEYAVGEERAWHLLSEEEEEKKIEAFRFIKSLTPSQIELIELNLIGKEAVSLRNKGDI